jgi:predicted nucleic acid-binding protein
MVLVDTSIWIDFLRRGGALGALLDNNQVLVHPFIVGELACGNLQNRDKILRYLQELPRVTVATDEEVLHFIQQLNLAGGGVGYLDMHLLASVQLHGQTTLWTRDKKLASASRELALAH